jgi:hypothetical protein
VTIPRGAGRWNSPIARDLFSVPYTPRDLAVRWSGSHKESLAPYVVELTAFHAEATGLLGLGKPEEPNDKESSPAKK